MPVLNSMMCILSHCVTCLLVNSFQCVPLILVKVNFCENLILAVVWSVILNIYWQNDKIMTILSCNKVEQYYSDESVAELPLYNKQSDL